MPYILSKERTQKLIALSNELFKMYVEFLETGNAKYLNFVLFRAAMKGVHECKLSERNRYETWRKVKSVQQDVLDEYKARMAQYEKGARKKNGDVYES